MVAEHGLSGSRNGVGKWDEPHLRDLTTVQAAGSTRGTMRSMPSRHRQHRIGQPAALGVVSDISQGRRWLGECARSELLSVARDASGLWQSAPCTPPRSEFEPWTSSRWDVPTVQSSQSAVWR